MLAEKSRWAQGFLDNKRATLLGHVGGESPLGAVPHYLPVVFIHTITKTPVLMGERQHSGSAHDQVNLQTGGILQVLFFLELVLVPDSIPVVI